MAPPTIGGHSYGRSPKAKKTSATARAFRLSNRNGLDLHQHRAGLCSYAKVQDVLVMFIFPFLVLLIILYYLFSMYFLIVCRKQTTKTSLLLL